jgi:hypothetical protein
VDEPALDSADEVREQWGLTKPRRVRREKGLVLLAIAVVGVALRVVLVLVAHPACPGQDERFARDDILTRTQLIQHLLTRDGEDSCFDLGGDPLSTVVQARMIADGHGMSSPIIFMMTGEFQPGAARPPAWTLMISALDVVGLREPTYARLLASALGGVTIMLIGHLAWQLMGRTAGLVAALIAAFNPNLFINDWRLLNDGPHALACTLILLASYRVWVRPTGWRAIVLGAVIGVSFYSRMETAMLLGLLVLPLMFWLRALPWRQRGVLAGASVLTALLFIAPFAAWNMSRFMNPQPTIGSGVAALNGSCDLTYYEDQIGMVGFPCFDAASRRIYLDVATGPADESVVDEDHARRAQAYIEANIRRVPLVAVVRVARVLGLYRPAQTVRYDIRFERRGEIESWLGMGAFYLLVPFTAAGLVHLRQRRITIVPFVAMAIATTLTVAGTFGLLRYRLAIDVGMCVLGAIGIAALARWYRDVRASRASPLDAAVSSARTMARRQTKRALALPPPVTLGAVGALAGTMVLLAWSATATPVAPEPIAWDLENPAPPRDEFTCELLHTTPQGLLQIIVAQEADEPVGVTPPGFAAVDSLRTQARDPLVRQEAQVLAEVLERASANALTIDEALQAGDPAVAEAFSAALNRLLYRTSEPCGA